MSIISEKSNIAKGSTSLKNDAITGNADPVKTTTRWNVINKY